MSVYVGGLDEDIKKKDLEKEFSRFGNLTKVWVAHRPPGFAFIDFQNENDANEAIKQMNGAIINRSKIRVNASHGGNKRVRGSGFCGGHSSRRGFEKGQDHSFDSGFRHRQRDFLQEGPRYQGGGYDRGSGYHNSSDIAWKPVKVLDYPELVKDYEDLSNYESSGKKRKLSCAISKTISSGSVEKKKAYGCQLLPFFRTFVTRNRELKRSCLRIADHKVKESNDTVMNINCLPEDILIEIFRYLSQDELCCIARVCKWWHKITNCPVLWKKINVLFQKSESQNKAASSICENLPTCVTHLKLDFHAIFWKEFNTKKSLPFEKFCIKLGKRCPSLKALILHRAEFSNSLQSAIDLCIQYMPNLEILSFRFCNFTADFLKIEYDDHCKIKVLDLFLNNGCRNYNKLTFPKMPRLKKLILPGSGTLSSWFDGDTSFLENLEVLNLQNTSIQSRTFQTLKIHAVKLIELYLCLTHVEDSDFRFSNSIFPHLKTLCLRYCPNVTYKAIISLILSCRSLQNVYVDHKVAASYAQHPFIIANKCKLEIVKSTSICPHKIDYLYEK